MADLRCGENPHQKASWEPNPNIRWTVHQEGKGLSYTNLLDLNAALRIVIEFNEIAAVVVKHTNPCGVALGDTATDAYIRARDADRLSAFGGIVGINRHLNWSVAKEITLTFVEAVIAPEASREALKILAEKPKIRVVTADYLAARDLLSTEKDQQRLLIGTLTQDRDLITEAHSPWPQDEYPKVVTKRSPTPYEWKALRFGWRVCAHVKSNAIVLTTENRTVGIGGGQPNRVSSAMIACGRLNKGIPVGAPTSNLESYVAASDAFFPFRDGLDEVAAAGATAVVQPGGSVKDEEVIAAADEHGLAMVFTGRRHFRH